MPLSTRYCSALRFQRRMLVPPLAGRGSRAERQQKTHDALSTAQPAERRAQLALIAPLQSPAEVNGRAPQCTRGRHGDAERYPSTFRVHQSRCHTHPPMLFSMFAGLVPPRLPTTMTCFTPAALAASIWARWPTQSTLALDRYGCRVGTRG